MLITFSVDNKKVEEIKKKVINLMCYHVDDFSEIDIKVVNDLFYLNSEGLKK